MSPRAKKFRNVLVALAAFALPYFGYHYGKDVSVVDASDRTREPLDESVPDLYLVSNAQGTFVEYQNKTRVRMEAYGTAVVTLEDYKATPDKLNAVSGFTEGDFPVVAFFNASGFDGSGGIDVLRRARDGEQLYRAKDKAKLVKAAVARRDGTFRAYFWDWTTETVAAKDWAVKYMGVEEVPVLPPPEELDKMTPEQLQKLGLQRMTKDEYEKKFGKSEAKKDPAATRQGVRGQVFQLPSLAPVANVEMSVISGKVDPKALKVVGRVAAEGRTDNTGTYSFALPDGEYTVVIKVGDEWRGNALSKTSWPSVEVKGKWVDGYDFRLAPK